MIDLAQYDAARVTANGNPVRKYQVSVWLANDGKEPSVRIVTFSAETHGRAFTRMTNVAQRKYPTNKRVLIEVV